MNTNIKSSKQMIDTAWQLFLVFAIVLGTMMVPMEALAANPIEQVLCNVVVFMTSTTGKAIATIAIIVVGLGALMGKISWGMALIVALGVALVFGAGKIVEALGGEGGTCAAGKLK
jgi:type IV secretion system protein VirB2